MWRMTGVARHHPRAIAKPDHIMGRTGKRFAGFDGRVRRIPPKSRELRVIRPPSEIDVLSFCGYLQN